MTTERETEALAVRREARKHGTDTPHRPTDEFVVHAFAEGAKHLWPDSRDPGWHVTFRRWLADHDARIVAEAEAREAERVRGLVAAALDAAPNPHPWTCDCRWCRLYVELRDLVDALADREEEA